MEQRPLSAKRGRRLIAATILCGVIALAAWWTVSARLVASGEPGGPASVAGADIRSPAGVRIRVEVLNATRTQGLARQATRWLRDGGFDVVFTGTSAVTHDTTLVLDRSGNPDWARAVAARLGDGMARVESRPDSSRYLDVTVLLGRTFRPPSQALHP